MVCLDGFVLCSPVPPIFQKVADATADFETPFWGEEARGGVTEYREIVENNPAYLYCDTNAVPAAELTWYRGDRPLSIEDGVSVLQGRPGLRGRAGPLQAGTRVTPTPGLVASAFRCGLRSPACCLLSDPRQGM